MPALECEVCGGKEFQMDVGKQICMECGTEKAHYIDIALENEHDVITMKTGSNRLIDISNKVQQEKDRKRRQKQNELAASSRWTTYEAFTLVLQEWAAILVQLGASSSLPKVVLKLWAGYLSKIEVAFLSSRYKNKEMIAKKPKLGFVENKRDMELLYQEKEVAIHAEISAHSKSKVHQKKNARNHSLKKIMNRVQRRFLKGKIIGKTSRAASVASDLSAYLLASEGQQNESEDDAGSTSSHRTVGGAGSSSSGSSAMSCSSVGSSSEGDHSDEEEEPKKRVYRSHYVLRWLKNKKNIYRQHDNQSPELQSDLEEDENEQNDQSTHHMDDSNASDRDGERHQNNGNCNASDDDENSTTSCVHPTATSSAVPINLSSLSKPSHRSSRKFTRSAHSVSVRKSCSDEDFNSSASKDLNKSCEILRGANSDDSDNPIDESVVGNHSSIKHEENKSDVDESNEAIDFTKIIEQWTSKNSAKKKMTLRESNRNTSSNGVQEDHIDISDCRSDGQEFTKQCDQNLHLTNPCYDDDDDDSVKDPDYEFECTNSDDSGSENLQILSKNPSHHEHSVQTTNIHVKRKRDHTESEQQEHSKRQRTFESRKNLDDQNGQSRQPVVQGGGSTNHSSGQGLYLPEATGTVPVDLDELDRLLQRQEPIVQPKAPQLKTKPKPRKPLNMKACERLFRTREPLMPSFSKLLALLYMACRINREEILLLDILRWCSSNHLPFTSAPYMLPDSFIKLTRYDIDMLSQCKCMPSHSKIRGHMARLSLLMDVQALPLPRLETVTSRMLHGLCLPEDMYDSVVTIVKKQLTMVLPTRLEYPGMELLVGGVIIFLLKASWGLNGVLENKLSAEVEHVNTELKKLGSDYRLFNWKTWHRYMMKVQWFNRTVDPGLTTKVRGVTGFTGRHQADRLAQYFWTHGIWRRPRSSANNDDKQASLLARLMQAQGLSLPQAVGEARLFQASYVPLTGLADQYRHCWKTDKGSDREEMKEVAESICNTSFESHKSGFLLDAASAVRKELLSCNSNMTVTVSCIDIFSLPWNLFNLHQKDKSLPRGTSILDDSDSSSEDEERDRGRGNATNDLTSPLVNGSLESEKIMDRRDGGDREINKQNNDCEGSLQSDKVNQQQNDSEGSSQSDKVKQHPNDSEGSLQSDKVRQQQNDSEDSIQANKPKQSLPSTSNDTAPELEQVVLTNPMEHMWLLSSFPGIRWLGVVVKNLPPSYRWLVKLMAEICCASETDVVWHAFRVERVVTIVNDAHTKHLW